MKGIIIYKVKYGATKQYAEWLGTALGLRVIPANGISGPVLREYDYLLLGTSVYIGRLQVKKWLAKNVPFLAGRKVFFFQVAGTPPEVKEKRQLYNDDGVPKELAGNFEYYFLPGRLIMENLSWKDRWMLKMGAWLTKDPVEKKTMMTNHDDVKKENLAEIIAGVNAFRQSLQEMARVDLQVL